jgi:hypothetical protein
MVRVVGAAVVQFGSLGLFSFLRLGRGNFAARLRAFIAAGVIVLGIPFPMRPNAWAFTFFGSSMCVT